MICRQHAQNISRSTPLTLQSEWVVLRSEYINNTEHLCVALIIHRQHAQNTSTTRSEYIENTLRIYRGALLCCAHNTTATRAEYIKNTLRIYRGALRSPYNLNASCYAQNTSTTRSEYIEEHLCDAFIIQRQHAQNTSKTRSEYIGNTLRIYRGALRSTYNLNASCYAQNISGSSVTPRIYWGAPLRA